MEIMPDGTAILGRGEALIREGSIDRASNLSRQSDLDGSVLRDDERIHHFNRECFVALQPASLESSGKAPRYVHGVNYLG
jgi:hypothetical protein